MRVLDRQSLTDDIVERFWSGMVKSGPGGCWSHGTGTRSRNANAFYWRDPRDGRRCSQSAAVLAFLLTSPEGIPDGYIVGHACNNRRCVNPDHLVAMTWSQRGLKSVRDGLRTYEPQPPRLGAYNPNSKMKPRDVREIRRRYAAGEKQSVLVAEFGVSSSAIHKIVHRQTWKDLPDEEPNDRLG